MARQAARVRERETDPSRDRTRGLTGESRGADSRRQRRRDELLNQDELLKKERKEGEASRPGSVIAPQPYRVPPPLLLEERYGECWAPETRSKSARWWSAPTAFGLCASA